MNQMGSTLKSYRLERCCTLEDISKKTNISINILQALENEEFHRLPGSFHFRNFLKGYLDALEVEPSGFFKTFENYINAVSFDYSYASPLNISKIRYYRFKKKHFLIKLATVILMLSGLGFVLIANRGKISPVANFFYKQLIVPEQILFPESIEKHLEYNFYPVQLSIKSQGRCWIQVKKGNTLMIDKILQKGEKYSIGGYQLTVSLGNPSLVAVLINNNIVKLYENVTTPRTFVFQPSNIKGYTK